MTLALNKHQRNKIFVLEMFHDDPEHTLERLKRLGNAQWFNSTDIFIYIVNLRGFEEEDEDIDYQRKYNACALGHWANVAAVGQTAEVDRLTAAHEVGHILFEPHHLPNKGHSQSRVNLMYAEGPKMTQVANLNVPGLTGVSGSHDAVQQVLHLSVSEAPGGTKWRSLNGIKPSCNILFHQAFAEFQPRFSMAGSGFGRRPQTRG